MFAVSMNLSRAGFGRGWGGLRWLWVGKGWDSSSVVPGVGSEDPLWIG